MAFNLNVERKESINKCVRFPVPLMNKIETVLKDYDISFSKFVIQACEYALEELETDDKKKVESQQPSVALFLTKKEALIIF